MTCGPTALRRAWHQPGHAQVRAQALRWRSRRSRWSHLSRANPSAPSSPSRASGACINACGRQGCMLCRHGTSPKFVLSATPSRFRRCSWGAAFPTVGATRATTYSSSIRTLYDGSVTSAAPNLIRIATCCPMLPKVFAASQSFCCFPILLPSSSPLFWIRYFAIPVYALPQFTNPPLLIPPFHALTPQPPFVSSYLHPPSLPAPASKSAARR